jgi:hypothetical protein
MAKKRRDDRRWWEDGEIAVMDADCFGGKGCEVEIKGLSGDCQDGAIYHVVECKSRQCYPVLDKHLKRPERRAK